MIPDDGRDTIFALSSGPAPAAIGVVRISGPGAGAALAALVGGLPPPRRATLRHVRAADGEEIDRALALWFPGPATATGEDLAELHVHGGRATIARMLAELGRHAGLRGAAPGEFTRRAFENGRIDLAQAEGLADLLAAETERQRRHALRVADGGLSALFEGWRTSLLALAARLEAQIEFADDEADVGEDPRFRVDLTMLVSELGAALRLPPAERLRDGVRIVVAGPPNAGKSTLINALAGREVAIATPVPGTTRDLIEASVMLDGHACIVIDSAGLRETDDIVERIGVDRATAAVASADLVLWLGTPDDRPGGNVIVVAAKADLAPAPPGHDVAICAPSGLGMVDLRAKIGAVVARIMPVDDQLVLHARQRASAASIVDLLKEALALADPILCAAIMSAALREMDRLIGRSGVEDMLDALFGRFCIGK